jgi:hypothetical protein
MKRLYRKLEHAMMSEGVWLFTMFLMGVAWYCATNLEASIRNIRAAF